MLTCKTSCPPGDLDLHSPAFDVGQCSVDTLNAAKHFAQLTKYFERNFERKEFPENSVGLRSVDQTTSCILMVELFCFSRLAFYSRYRIRTAASHRYRTGFSYRETLCSSTRSVRRKGLRRHLEIAKNEWDELTRRSIFRIDEPDCTCIRAVITGCLKVTQWHNFIEVTLWFWDRLTGIDCSWHTQWHDYSPPVSWARTWPMSSCSGRSIFAQVVSLYGCVHRVFLTIK